MEKELQDYAIDPMPIRERVLEEFNKWTEEKAKDAKSKGFFAKLRKELEGIFFILVYFLILLYFSHIIFGIIFISKNFDGFSCIHIMYDEYVRFLPSQIWKKNEKLSNISLMDSRLRLLSLSWHFL